MKEIINSVLRVALVGELHTHSTFDAEKVSDEIAKTVSDAQIKSITDIKDELEKDLLSLGKEEILLRNFVRGRIESIEQIIDLLK